GCLRAVAPGRAGGPAAAQLPPAGIATHARPLVLALLPTEQPRRVVMPPVALLDAPPPKPPEPPEPPEPPAPRQRAISAAVGYALATLSESELAFTKGNSPRPPPP